MSQFPSDLAELLTQKIGIIGAGLTGYSIAATLGKLGAHLWCTDGVVAKAVQLQQHFSDYHIEILPWESKSLEACDLLITSPGLAPHAEIFPADTPIWGDYELAWFLNEWEVFGSRKRWLAITGTNGKTTTTMMCEAIAREAGLAAMSCGNIGTAVLDVVREKPELDYLIVEMSSFQLHYAPSFHPDVGVVLNIAPDHIDWHGSFAAYVDDKFRVLTGPIGIVGIDDPVAGQLIPVHQRVDITLHPPQPGQLGLDDQGFLLDRAFSVDGQSVQLVHKDHISPGSPAGWIDALAASALTRALEISPEVIARALTNFRPAAHRGEIVFANEKWIFIDNSKATNPHATVSAMNDVALLYPLHQLIMIMGGQLKGADIVELVQRASEIVSMVVIFGQDTDVVRQAFLQHAPNIFLICIYPREDKKHNDNCEHQLLQKYIPDLERDIPIYRRVPEQKNLVELYIPQLEWNGLTVMQLAVQAAKWQGQEHERTVVLFAPAAASLDMYSGYAQRGEMFAQAVHVQIGR